jgi:hypothetical protein
MSAFTYIAGRNDDAARDRAFYLLKKYTSATLLRRAIDLFVEFLRDFEREIKKPKYLERNWVGQRCDYDGDLRHYLRYLVPMECARPLLTDPTGRPQAFQLLRDAIGFGNHLWGRWADEVGADSPNGLFYKLGYRRIREDSIGLFGKVDLSGTLISLLLGTINKAAQTYLSEPVWKARSVMCWTYESIFFDTLPINHVPSIVFPEHLPRCPPRNEASEGQVSSGETIPVTGIWEPWSLDPKLGVRCPNYFLVGDTASQYQFEGTETLEDVRWRLIWKDTRYSNGGIPDEEADYFASEQHGVAGVRFQLARPGTTCPESGDWYSPQLRIRQRVEHGARMPGPDISHSGADVLWCLWIVEPEPARETVDELIARLGYNPVADIEPLYCKSREICPKTGVWLPIVPDDIIGYARMNFPGSPKFEPLYVEQGTPMMRFGAYTPEDEARVVWRWIGERGEYRGRRTAL